MLHRIGTQEIETERLLLRRFVREDAETMFRNWTSDPEVTRFLRFQTHTSVDDSHEVIARLLERYETEDVYSWGIERKGGELIGRIVVHSIHETDACGEVAYVIGRAFWGQGYTSEALRAVIDYMFSHVGLNRIEAWHSVNNPASGSVMRKAGMLREGRARQKYRSREGYQDSELYGITREDWEVAREIQYYNAMPVMFSDFIEPEGLTDGEIDLFCAQKNPAQPERKWVPSYAFEIRKDGACVGHIGLRIGYTDGLYYGGQIGYDVDEACRGRGYAGRACRLLIPVMRAHGMQVALITNNVNNKASRRVCEKLGARLLRAVRVPEWSDLYENESSAVNVFAWEFGL